MALIYGPSGCGKTSFVKAGLLPRLGDQIVSICIECTAANTEDVLLRELRKACPELPRDLDLGESISILRKRTDSREGRMTVIFLDQFEQWLHARQGKFEGTLVQALRQCD